MRIIQLFLIFSLSYGFINAQYLTEVPKNITSNFNAIYNDAEQCLWIKDKENYIVTFKKANKEGKAILSERGILLSGEEEIDKSTLPVKIILFMETEYKGFVINNTKKAQDKINYFYIINANKGNENKTLRFSLNGNLVS